MKHPVRTWIIKDSDVQGNYKTILEIGHNSSSNEYTPVMQFIYNEGVYIPNLFKSKGVNYLTNEDLATTLSEYVSETDLSSQLSGYVTNEGLTTTLNDYVG